MNANKTYIAQTIAAQTGLSLKNRSSKAMATIIDALKPMMVT